MAERNRAEEQDFQALEQKDTRIHFKQFWDGKIHQTTFLLLIVSTVFLLIFFQALFTGKVNLGALSAFLLCASVALSSFSTSLPDSAQGIAFSRRLLLVSYGGIALAGLILILNLISS